MNEGSEKQDRLSKEEQAEFSSYIANRFEGCREVCARDTDHLRPWESIVFYAGLYGAAEAINAKVCPKRPVKFRSPEGISIRIEDSFAGKIPVIRVRDVSDFENLVTNAAYKGERPDNIDRTGASFLYGKTVRYIILSYKPYSNVPAEELGLDDAEWKEKSIQLRFGHECTHFFTKQTYGISNNILHDEIMADFIGMYEAFGFYKAEWFLRFMGIDGDGSGRMIFYTKELGANVRRAASSLIQEAAYGLERWSETDEFAVMTVSERIKWMCREGLQGILMFARMP